jgi:acylphosphatase
MIDNEQGKKKAQSDKASVVILVVGKVQGVFYRASTMEEAQRLSLCGWVRNLGDGSVEVEAEGERDILEFLVKWCHEGPADAQVESVYPRWGVYRGQFNTFKVVY